MKPLISLWESVRKIAGDAIVAALLSFGAIALFVPQSKIITAEITARMPGTDFAVWDEQGLLRYDAPQVPAPAATYSLDDIMRCRWPHRPEAAWAEVHTSWPTPEVMYTVNAHVSRKGEIAIALRTRQNYSRGYAYIDVMARCRLDPAAIVGRVLGSTIAPGADLARPPSDDS